MSQLHWPKIERLYQEPSWTRFSVRWMLHALWVQMGFLDAPGVIWRQLV